MQLATRLLNFNVRIERLVADFADDSQHYNFKQDAVSPGAVDQDAEFIILHAHINVLRSEPEQLQKPDKVRRHVGKPAQVV